MNMSQRSQKISLSVFQRLQKVHDVFFSSLPTPQTALQHRGSGINTMIFRSLDDHFTSCARTAQRFQFFERWVSTFSGSVQGINGPLKELL